MYLEELEKLILPKDFNESEKLYSMKGNVYFSQCYNIQDMIQNGLNILDGPHGFYLY